MGQMSHTLKSFISFHGLWRETNTTGSVNTPPLYLGKVERGDSRVCAGIS